MSAAEAPEPQKTLMDWLREVMEESSSTSPHEIAAEILDRLSDEESLTYFAHILPAWVSSKMSYDVTTVPGPALVKGGEYVIKKTTIKKHGQPLYISLHGNTWDKKRLSSGVNGVWVFWPDFTSDMALTKIESLKSRVQTTLTNISKYEQIVFTLKEHGVEKVGDLPASAKAALEKALDALPEDDD